MHGLCWWKKPIELKLHSYFSSLRHIEHDKVDIMCFVHCYNMGDNITLKTS
jgi:hypothetical protein